MDLKKQIEYWRAGSEEDFEAGAMMIENGRPRHGLFFAHLAVEKMLKAHVVKSTGQVPPKIHNLVRLVELGGLSLNGARGSFWHG